MRGKKLALAKARHIERGKFRQVGWGGVCYGPCGLKRAKIRKKKRKVHVKG